MSIDQLEIQLRMLGISNYEEIKTVTIETNGQLVMSTKICINQ